jgi:uncharacterized protein (TIGR02996 family)
VTTEEDFQTALDANPDDWQTRLVFADWLEERADPRAAGYRALAVRRWHAYRPNFTGYWTVGNYRADHPNDVSDLPDDWFDHVWNATPRDSRTKASRGRWVALDTRRTAEDAAALAFAKLSAKRQHELLAAEPAPQTDATPAKRPKGWRKK